jgi:hypothetical protein
VARRSGSRSAGIVGSSPTCRCSACRANHDSQGRPVGVYGSKGDDIPSGGSTARTLEEGREAMGIDWMSWSALVEAIPPAYTAFIGAQLLDHIGRAAA